ncbi:MAG: DNRLRE domain-containing protein, partial [Methylococcales bacterium]
IAAIAFLLNRDNGMNINMVSVQTDTDRARYAAEAGLQAVNAKIQSLGCAGGFPVIGTPVTNSNFSGAGYSAYATSASGNTTGLVSTGTFNGTSVTLTRNNIYVYQTTPNAYTLQPDATVGMDTYIDSATATNHGIAATLNMETNQSMLFKFDLSAFPAGSRPISAKFAIKQNGALLSSSSFYRMATDWVEGTGASSPLDGATWGTKNGSTAWVTPGGDYFPGELNNTAVINVYGSWAEFDATNIAAAWLSGQYPNYGVIVKSNANNSPTFISSDGATSADRPKITFNYLVPCGSAGPADPPPITNVTLIPTADSFNDSGATSANNGAVTTIKTYYTPTRENRILMQVDTSSIPSGSSVQSAILRMYVSTVGSATSNTKPIWVNAINESWIEGTGNNTNKTCPSIKAGTSWNYKTDCTNWASNIHPPNTPETWNNETAMKIKRAAHVVATVNGKIYAIGGQTAVTGVASNAVEEYDPATKTWATKSSVNFTARSNAAAAVVNNKIYVFGGTTDGINAVNKNQVYDPNTDTWSTLSNMPVAKMYLAAAVANNIIYTIGGATNSTTAQNTVNAYDPASDKWLTKAPATNTTLTNMLSKRAWPAAQGVNGKIYVFGGISNITLSTSLSSTEFYDPATNTWASRLALPVTADSMSSAVLGNKIYLISGFQNGALSKGVRAYDTLTDTYKSLLSYPIASNQAAAATVSGKLFSLGGDDNVATVYSNHYQYDPGAPVPIAIASEETGGASPLTTGFNRGWINFNIKTLVQEWVDGVRPNNGLVIYTEVADQFNINSRENSTNKPQLIITY